MTDSLSCDVAVVGAGPAGATAACLLARKGYQVCLLDKRVFPRPKLCAGLLTWKTTRLIETIFETSIETLKKDQVIKHASRAYRIYFEGKEIAKGQLDTPFHFTDRSTYDAYWLAQARAAGARVETPARVVRVDHEKGVLDLSDGRRINARLLIGADGVWSKVRSTLLESRVAKKTWALNLGAALETHLPYGAKRPRPSFAALHFGYVPWGYAWSFPGATHQTVGMCFLAQKSNHPVRRTFDEFLASVDINPDAPPPTVRSYPLPYGNYMRRPAEKRALLVGDACGLADPLLGEGIYYAHRSATLAAQTIIECAQDWNKVAGIYTDRLNRQIIREFNWIRLFRNALFAGGCRRRYRGLKLCLRLLPKRLEAAVQGRYSFSRLWVP